jgi:hypothetical protein
MDETLMEARQRFHTLQLIDTVFDSSLGQGRSVVKA